mgnify:CR=1 FL=1
MKKRGVLIVALSAVVVVSCYKETFIPAGEGLADWTTASHSSSATPDYDIVFPQDKVSRFDITISSENWEAMQDNLYDLYGGTSSGGPGGPGGGTTFSDETPIYIPCNLAFNGTNWYNVGIRYKGNSSLKAYSSGVNKLPFRLEFDQFEDDYPEIMGQTFYGFPALSMSSNYNDKSFMREKVACDLFREFGVPAPHTAYYEMYIDYGEGPVHYGLYTAVEVAFETMLEKQFGSNTGNCYKPDGDGAAFATTGFTLADFENKTTGGTGESDIQTLYDLLHDGSRTSDLETWKTNLEAVLDVNVFLKWLAVNTTIQNWDTYGRMTHNYYLYHDPADGLIKWIPWDNNEAFEEGKMGGALSFEFEEINASDWPLIGYITAIPEYEDLFKTHIANFITTAFEPGKMQNYYDEMQSIIQSSVEAEASEFSFLNSIGDFSTAVNELKSHVEIRVAAAEEYAY